MNFKQANGENFAQGRTHPIQFLVIHYTANNGDTVQNNLDYFAAMQWAHQPITSWMKTGMGRA